MGFVLKDRLKGLKVGIKGWSAEVYGKIDEKKKQLVAKILELDLKSESTGISAEEVAGRKRLFDDLWLLLKSIEASIFQRSRTKWLKEGDANTWYFHSCLTARKRGNNISVLRTSDGWVEGPVNVREATVTFFRKHFDNVEWNRPVLEGVVLPVLSEERKGMRVSIFTMDEIEAAIKSSDGSKCPGPDGFNFAFLKEFWGLMRNEIRILFDQFHANDCVPKCLMSYFLTLVPKIKSPQSLGDFRPISLLGCLYKLLAKVLTSRLAKAIDPLIPKTQTAFLKGRQLVEGVVVVNEVIDYAKKSGKECVILKVDFEKAYDSVDWSFLDFMLQKFGFCEKWRAWMRAYVCAGNMFVLVNGSPTEEINIKRGLKQGDPLAPLLFLLVAEGLGSLMRRAVELN
ncbi:LINE-1 reverse transcriptase like, partial [Trifolium medium]|nr:LINE-1 reverse transcriptase like [Trifolium medium]